MWVAKINRARDLITFILACPGQVTGQIKPVTGTQDGQEALAQQTARFMEPPPPGEQPPEKRRRLGRKSRPAQPRLPTLHWIFDMKHCLEMLGRPLRQFVATEDIMASENCPAILTVCTDQESLQLAAANFLKWHVGLMMEHVYDPQHRRSNDSTLALAECGLLQRCCMNLCLFNLKFGPFLKGGWHTLIIETACKVSEELSPNDPVLKHFMPSILEDYGETWDQNTEARRRRFLLELPTAPFVTSKGPKAAMSRFNSVTQAALFLDQHWSAQAFLFTMTCLIQGWVECADQLWQPDDVNAADCPGGAEGPVSADDSGAASASAGPSTSKVQAKLEAKKALERMRGKAVNTFHCMTRFLNDPESKTFCRIMAYLQEAEAASSGLMLHRMRGEQATKEQFAAWADRSFLHELKDMLLVLKDQTKLKRMGFAMYLLASAHKKDQIAMDNSIAATVFSAVRSFLKFRCGSMLWHTWSLPCVSALLLHDDAAKVQKGLAFLKSIFGTCAATENEGSLASKNLLHGQGSSSPAMRWMLRRLSEVDFAAVPAEVGRCLSDMFSALLNSKLVEDLQKLQREHEVRTASSKQISKMEAWRVGSQHNLLKSYDRKEVGVSTFLFQPENFQEAKLFVAPQKHADSDPPDEIAFCKKLKEVTGQTSWPTFTPESQQQIFANLALLRHIHDGGKDWQMVECAYRASFLPEGHCILQGGSLYYVVRVYEHAALCWPATLHATHVALNMNISELAWIFVFAVESVKVIRLEAVSPIYMYDAYKKANAGITLKNHPPTSVLDHHMETGFSGLKETALRRLLSDLGIPETSCGIGVPEEVALAATLMLNVNPLLTESSVVGKLLLREQTPGHAMVGSEESLDEAVKDTVLTGEAEKILSHVKKFSESKLAEQLETKKKVARMAFGKVMDAIPLEKIKAAKAKLSKEPKKTVPSTGSGSAKDQRRVYDKLKASIDNALRQNVPDQVKVFTDEQNGRWKICWEKASLKQKSISWTAIGAVEACNVAVKLAWNWSEEQTGIPMPQKIRDKMAKLS